MSLREDTALTSREAPIISPYSRTMPRAYLTHRRDLLQRYPDYCTVSDVARMLGVTRWSIKHHDKHLRVRVVEGMKLYHAETAKAYAAFYKGKGRLSALSLKGVDVEHMQRICAYYFRRNVTSGPRELVALAKRIARL